MRQIDVDVPYKLYLDLVDRCGSHKKATDLISLRIEQALKMERWLMRLRPKDIEATKVISVFVPEYLYPYFNEYCIHRQMTKRELVIKLIKRILKK